MVRATILALALATTAQAQTVSVIGSDGRVYFVEVPDQQPQWNRPTQDPNPFFAGYNAHKRAQAELEALRAQNELLRAQTERLRAETDRLRAEPNPGPFYER